MKNVIQVAGSVRSGTTITSLILGKASNTMALGEIMHLFRPYRKAHLAMRERIQTDEKWKYIIISKEHTLYERIFKAFSDVSTIVDSSKDPFWFLEQKRKSTDLSVKTIATYKSPAALEQSFDKRQLDNWFKVFVNYYRRLLNIFPDVRTVCADDVLQQACVRTRLAQHIDIDPDEIDLEYWTKRHPNFFGSDTVKSKRILRYQEIPPLETRQKVSRTWWKKIEAVFSELERRNIREETFSDRSIPSEILYSGLIINLYKLKDFHLHRLKADRMLIRK